MFRTSVAIVGLLGLGFALGCVRDNPQPAARNTASADPEQQTAQTQTPQTGDGQKDSKKANEGLNKVSDSVALGSGKPDPHSPNDGRGAKSEPGRRIRSGARRARRDRWGH